MYTRRRKCRPLGCQSIEGRTAAGSCPAGTDSFASATDPKPSEISRTWREPNPRPRPDYYRHASKMMKLPHVLREQAAPGVTRNLWQKVPCHRMPRCWCWRHVTGTLVLRAGEPPWAMSYRTPMAIKGGGCTPYRPTPASCDKTKLTSRHTLLKPSCVLRKLLHGMDHWRKTSGLVDILVDDQEEQKDKAKTPRPCISRRSCIRPGSEPQYLIAMSWRLLDRFEISERVVCKPGTTTHASPAGWRRDPLDCPSWP